jgi:hypothetical protein
MMRGLPYKDTFAAKGSELYTALDEGREQDAKRIYAITTARNYALLNRLAVPAVVYEVDKEGKQTGKWRIEAADATYDNNGRLKEKK